MNRPKELAKIIRPFVAASRQSAPRFRSIAGQVFRKDVVVDLICYRRQAPTVHAPAARRGQFP
jgi:hypothetical protein